MTESTVIDRALVQQMFDRSKRNPNVKWDIEGPCLWGFFFLDGSPDRLREAGRELESKGYRVVEPPYLLDREGQGSERVYMLHVERIEQHTVDSLDRRNHELYRFAAERGLRSYDGMDVGPVPAAPTP